MRSTPEANENLYAGTDLGTFHSSDDGGHMEDYSLGMPAAMVLDLTVSRANGKLRASTFGSGVYQRSLVREPRLTLTYPNGGEILAGGRQESITWEERFLDRLDIEYSTDNGLTWSVVASEIDAAQGSYIWTVPEEATFEGLLQGERPRDKPPSRFERHGVLGRPEPGLLQGMEHRLASP